MTKGIWETGVRHEDIGTPEKPKIWSFVYIKNDARKIKLRMGGVKKDLDKKMKQAQEIADRLNAC